MSTARSGNVIGGGDWSENRLIPDIIRSVKNNTKLEIRSPEATRPWQRSLRATIWICTSSRVHAYE